MMTMSRPLLPMLLLSLLAMPARAQRISPVALHAAPVNAPVAGLREGLRLVTKADTVLEPDGHISTTKTIVGGVLGGALGAIAGMAIGSQANADCGGDLCGLEGAALGLLIGEPLGLAIGAHLGSGSRQLEKLPLTALTTAAVLVGGVFTGVGLESAARAGAVMIPLTPVLQLVTAVAIEKY
jgi:hypothetical protein